MPPERDEVAALISHLHAAFARHTFQFEEQRKAAGVTCATSIEERGMRQFGNAKNVIFFFATMAETMTASGSFTQSTAPHVTTNLLQD